jgi:hypothetical protein
MVEMGKKLTVKDDSGNVTQWGVHIPSSGFPSWLWTGIVAGNGGLLADDTGKNVNFNFRRSRRRARSACVAVGRGRRDGSWHSRLGWQPRRRSSKARRR